MSHLKMLVFVCIVTWAISLRGASPPPASVDALLDAMVQVESGGRAYIVGDQGRSRGYLQISKAYYQDTLDSFRRDGVEVPPYAVATADPYWSRQIVLRYWQRYCPSALASGDLKTLARCHNGGPSGDRKSATLGYWDRVQAAMQR